MPWSININISMEDCWEDPAVCVEVSTGEGDEFDQTFDLDIPLGSIGTSLPFLICALDHGQTASELVDGIRSFQE